VTVEPGTCDWVNRVDAGLLLYSCFLAALAVTFTPTFDAGAGTVAKGFVYALLGFLAVDRKPRQ